MNILGLILAKSCSSRLPLKNIRPLAGQPLLAYTIACARESRHINRVVVSTEDKAVAEIARRYGAETPFLRPLEMATPDALEFDAIVHAVDTLRDRDGYIPDLIVKLLPTSPLRKSASVDAAIEILLAKSEADSVRSLKRCTEHPGKMWTFHDGILKSLAPAGATAGPSWQQPYQLLPEVYVQNASFDVFRPQNLGTGPCFLGKTILGYVMDAIESHDINSELDFLIAEYLVLRERPEENNG